MSKICQNLSCTLKSMQYHKCLDLNIFQQDDVSAQNSDWKYNKFNKKTSLSQIWVNCDLLPFVSVGQIASGQLQYEISSEICHHSHLCDHCNCL